MLLLSACASGDYRSGPPPATTTTTSTSTTVAAELTIRGVVGSYSSSARVLTLAQPVSGFTDVVVAADTEVVRASGARATAADLVARANVEIVGRRSAPGTLAARRVVLL